MKRALTTLAVLALGCTGGENAAPNLLPLPGADYYPESIAADADGSLYVSSLVTGQVVKFEEGSDEGTVFVASGGPLRGATGVVVQGGSLWACDVDLTFSSTSNVVRIDLATGAAAQTLALPTFGFCNDLAFDGAGNLYAADSFGAIHRLASGASGFTVWSNAAELAPTQQGAFGADGIAWDGGSNVYVNTFTAGRLFRIPILGNGSAGTLAEITVTPALSYPDGMRSISADRLVVVEGAGRLTEVTITGVTATASLLADGLDAPTSAISAGGDWWVTEGQIPDFLAGTDPDLPFAVRRVRE